MLPESRTIKGTLDPKRSLVIKETRQTERDVDQRIESYRLPSWEVHPTPSFSHPF